MRIESGMKVLITGAASGIGRALVLKLSEFRVEFLLADFNGSELESLGALLRQRGLVAHTFVCDLADSDQVEALAKYAHELWGELHILVNNAGIAWYGPTLKTPEAEWDKIMEVNLNAPMRLTRRLLPLLLAQAEGHVVNTASICGLVAASRLTAYSASKFGLVGFSEAIRGEFGRYGLGVTAVCPGPVRTRLLEEVPCGSSQGKIPRPPRWTSTSPEHVANVIVRGIQRNRATVVITWLARLIFQCKRFVPGFLDAIQSIGRRRKIAKKMSKLKAQSSAPCHPPAISRAA